MSGRLENGVVRLHPYGKFVEEEWLRTAEIRPEIVLDEYIVMPDHFHAIVWITDQSNIGPGQASPHDVSPFATDGEREVLGEASLAPTVGCVGFDETHGGVRPVRCNIRNIAGRIMFWAHCHAPLWLRGAIDTIEIL